MDTKSVTNKESTVGLGVDIVDVNQIKEIIERTPNFLDYTFSDSEIKYCKSTTRWAEHFATHFAAKEAVLKSLGCGFAKDVEPKDIEVFHDKNGKPYIVLYNQVKEIAKIKGVVDIPISLSFTNKEAVGFSIALTEKSSKENDALKKSADPMQILSKQFKEAKKLLEDNSEFGNNFNNVSET